MTTAAPEKGKTVEAPLRGGKDGKTLGLDGKTVLKDRVDPLVMERAKNYVDYLEKIEDATDKAKKAHGELKYAFQKSKRARTVKVVTDRRSYRFELKSDTKLVTIKDKILK